MGLLSRAAQGAKGFARGVGETVKTRLDPYLRDQGFAASYPVTNTLLGGGAGGLAGGLEAANSGGDIGAGIMGGAAIGAGLGGGLTAARLGAGALRNGVSAGMDAMKAADPQQVAMVIAKNYDRQKWPEVLQQIAQQGDEDLAQQVAQLLGRIG